MLASILGALSLLIVVTAASNLGGVFLARATSTRRQAAVHLALGSGRAAVIRRLLCEGALLGTIAAALALAGYAWVRAQMAEVALLPTLALRLDLPLDLATTALVIGSGLLAGLGLAAGPALWASRVELGEAMHDGDRRAAGSSSITRVRRGLVAAQMALSLTLVVGAALFSRTLVALSGADVGFPRERLVAMDFDLEPAQPPAAALPGLARAALDGARRTPGILAAAMSNRAPVDQSTPSLDVRKAGEDDVAVSDVTFYLATVDYFATVGVPLVAGRAFTADETEARADVVIVNQALAAALFPGGDALERRIDLGDGRSRARVIGIARDAKYRALSEHGRPHLYRPTPPALGLTLLARTADNPRGSVQALQRTLSGIGPGLVGFFPRTMDDHLAIELLPARAAAGAAALFGSVALVLSGVGLFGLVSWFVAMRRREIGIRVALGASVRDVRTLVVGQALATALPGIAAGALLAAALALSARAALYGVGPLDPIAFAIGLLALLFVVVGAAFVPSYRAARVDPAIILRTE
jgi:putative ABC transport system permease protein